MRTMSDATSARSELTQLAQFEGVFGDFAFCRVIEIKGLGGGAAQNEGVVTTLGIF
jgi:hypothetical protein